MLQQVLNDLQNDPSAWPFAKPVDASIVHDYYTVITDPMGGYPCLMSPKHRLTADLSTMESKLDNNHYTSVEDFIADARLMFANCRQYNGEKNQYANLANKLERSLERILKKRMQV